MWLRSRCGEQTHHLKMSQRASTRTRAEATSRGITHAYNVENISIKAKQLVVASIYLRDSLIHTELSEAGGNGAGEGAAEEEAAAGW